MKVSIQNLWDESRKRPNIYFYLRPEDETERALLMSLYGIKPRFFPQINGEHLLDFFPPGDPK